MDAAGRRRVDWRSGSMGWKVSSGHGAVAWIWISCHASKTPSEPVVGTRNLGSIVNSLSSDFAPSLSPGGRTLSFASARPGGYGNFDLNVSTRSRIR